MLRGIICALRPNPMCSSGCSYCARSAQRKYRVEVQAIQRKIADRARSFDVAKRGAARHRGIASVFWLRLPVAGQKKRRKWLAQVRPR